ncbi:Peptidase T [bioreactor metagenome]|uniref:Peptidase T n=1 Tax=bioreactor metagenome TaxID=1076179 RepID=A0A644Z1V6_9ZZZZ
MTSVKDRFLEYIKVDTRSEYDKGPVPSSKKQFDLANLLAKQLKEMGVKDVEVDDKCYLMATIPANTDKKVPTIGFISHVDTSPDASGANVKPRIIADYDGKDIVLNQDLGIVMDIATFPEISKYAGQEIIVTDGTTLLGADDKAGVAAIMALAETLMKNPSIKHGAIKIGFTPDEEVGRGADFFNVGKFGADFAYTVDGGELGELEYESFNAARATVTIKGKNVHPGYAKDKMVNAVLVAMEFNALLPVNERPEFTGGYDGFVHAYQIEGTVEASKMVYLVRDHDRKLFEKRKAAMLAAAEFLNARYGVNTISIKLEDQYYNMGEMIAPRKEILDLALKAFEAVGVKPIVHPIRGGTDGSRLSFMGLPCPNIFAGGLYFHGKYECLPTRSLEKAVEVLLKIVELSAE